MKTIKISLVVLCFLFLSEHFAQSIPTTINYQGALKDASGNNVPNGNYTLTFNIYNTSSGGTALWTETKLVNVEDGIFSTLLGSLTAITLPFDAAYWLGVVVGGTEFSPRIAFSSVPYSRMSLNVPDNSLTAIKISSGQVVKSLNGIRDNVNLVAGSNVTITPSGNNITISSSGGGGGTVTQVSTGAGLTGGPITTTGTISVPNSGITSAMLQNNSVTSAKIVDGTITAADIGNTQVVKSINTLKDDVSIVAGSNITITPSGNNLTISSTAGGFGGTGTTNYIPRFTGDNTLGNSALFQSGTNLGIGTTTPSYPLHVNVNNSTAAIYSVNTATGINSAGVYGQAAQLDWFGTGGYFIGGWIGVLGIVTPSGDQSYVGVYGSVAEGTSTAGDRYGVYGVTSSGGTGGRIGVYGQASGGTTNWAGYFLGNVNVTGTLSKGGGSFKIDHPLDPANKYLYHSFVESPDMMNIYNGNVVTDGSGDATVLLPDWFEALNKDFRYQLTVIGDFAQAIIAEEVRGNQFAIRTDKPNIKVSWQVTGIRKDAFAEKYRIPVEELKQAEEIGKYAHPEAFGLPETLGIDFKHRISGEERRSLNDR